MKNLLTTPTMSQIASVYLISTSREKTALDH